MSESWKTVLWFPQYEVSDLGRVRRKGSNKCLTPSCTYGYEHVTFAAGSRRAQPRVNVLVCEAFHGPRPSSRHQAAHRDGVRTNNTKDNLRWATVVENAFDKRAHGTHIKGSKVAGAKLVETDIPPIRALLGAFVPAVVIAEAYGVTPENIAHIANDSTWKHVEGVGRQ